MFVAASATAFAPAREARGEDAADPDPYGRVLDDVRARLKRATVERAVTALRLLDPANPRSLPLLVEQLAQGHWFVRGHAIEALAGVPAGPLRDEMRLHLLTHEDAWVREGLAHAMAEGPTPGDADALVGAMDDSDWRVRRTSARALGEIVSRDGAGRLVRALGEERDLRVLVWIRRSLRLVVGKDLGRDLAAWTEWWKVHRDKEEWKAHGDETVRKDFAGVPLETFTYESSVTIAESERRRKRPDLFVLAPLGHSHDFYRPYLDEASRFVRITYVTLPSTEELTGHSGYGASIPVYPVKKLAKALDRLRAHHEKEQVIVMAWGAAVWIAERYALTYPRRTAGLVLVNGWLDAQSYAEGLTRLAAEGSRSERWAADFLLGTGERSHDRLTGERLRRVMLTHSLGDRRDSEAWRLWRDTRRDQGFVTVPPITFSRRTRIESPTLFSFPADSPLGGGTAADLRRIRESFKDPPPITAVVRESRGLSHVEDPAEFLRVLEGFLRYARLLPR